MIKFWKQKNPPKLVTDEQNTKKMASFLCFLCWALLRKLKTQTGKIQSEEINKYLVCYEISLLMDISGLLLSNYYLLYAKMNKSFSN